MLLELHVKNLALIEKADIEFGRGLNILTGETGAGKSIVIGSVTIALGGKAPRDIVRKGAEYAYIELVFQVEDQEKLRALRDMDIFPAEDGIVVVSKKITLSRSVGKINDETVTAGKLREITSLLIDIHGQHEHQSLLYKARHLEILDKYIRHESQPLKQQVGEAYKSYLALKSRMEDFNSDQESRLREADFCRFEIEEIESADLTEGEEEELKGRHRLLANARKIVQGLSAAYQAVQYEGIGRALGEVLPVAELDGRLGAIRDQLYDVDSILSDVTREIASYMDDISVDEPELEQIEKRLDAIHNLQAKYGDTVSLIMERLEEKKRRLEELENFEFLKQKTGAELSQAEKKLETLCGKLSALRKRAAKELTRQIKKSLEDLNFIDVEFQMQFTRLDHFTGNGFDTAEFMISTNPGEDIKPLGMVASGGELSRIMLAVKAVLADSDDIPTLIFDEIDTGISGRTAQKVSEKLSYIALSHQVICITHLPQIAAMADAHFEIAKSARDNSTVTTIRPLSREQMVEELARLLGGAEITQTVQKTAGEMKALAEKSKKGASARKI